MSIAVGDFWCSRAYLQVLCHEVAPLYRAACGPQRFSPSQQGDERNREDGEGEWARRVSWAPPSLHRGQDVVAVHCRDIPLLSLSTRRVTVSTSNALETGVATGMGSWQLVPRLRHMMRMRTCGAAYGTGRLVPRRAEQMRPMFTNKPPSTPTQINTTTTPSHAPDTTMPRTAKYSIAASPQNTPVKCAAVLTLPLRLANWVQGAT
jgi:hypothetical protein